MPPTSALCPPGLQVAGQPSASHAVHSQLRQRETGNRQLKTYLRGPGKILRWQSPDLVKQEIWGYLLTHYAISALICTATGSMIRLSP
jgi:hypothetical protein